jgi:glutamate-1-semialdehyde 2,1-aminomutase
MNAIDACRERVFADYRRKTKRSFAFFERAKLAMPGGVSGNLRYFAPYPLYMAHGSGCTTVDVDGNEYIDCFGCNGPLLLGHRPNALSTVADKIEAAGALLVNPTLMIDCAEALKRVIPCAERVRFLNSGTEAVMTAVRCARAFTGKDNVVKFYGHYHGQDDQFLLGLSPTRMAFGAGVPNAHFANTLTLPFNNIAAFEKLMREREDIACVILDPAMHLGGLWGASKDFLIAVRDATRKAGVVLIFDEVITGFRMGLGGAQEYYGVTPDLTTLAKALAAGEKLGAVVGSADIMAVFDPLAPAASPRAFQSGTANDGSGALIAALGAITEYERLAAEGRYQLLWRQVEQFDIALREIVEAASIPLTTNRLCSMMQLFHSRRPGTFESYSGLNNAVVELFYLALINEGVLLSLPTSNHIYFSFAHDEGAFAIILQAVNAVLEKYPFQPAFAEIHQ